MRSMTPHTLLIALLVASAGCASEETTRQPAADTSTDGSAASDTSDGSAETDTTADAEVDTAEDTAADTAEDTAADTAEDTAADTAEDTTADTAEDTIADTAEDTAPDTSPDTSVEPIDPSRVILDGPCPQESRVGGFKVEMNGTIGYTAIDGVVRNGVPPSSIADPTFDEAGCRLLRRRRLVCEPPCAPSQTCDVGAACIPAPLGQDQGQVTFTGLVAPVTLSPLPPGSTYFFTRLTHPGFAPGDLIRLTSTPGYLGALELYGVGVSQVVPTEPIVVVTEGQPLALAWDAGAPDARSRVLVELTIDQHGLTPVTAACDLPDTGSALIPAAVVDGLVAAGVTGFPSGRVTRRTVDSVTVGDQCAEFIVSSVRDLQLEVTGFVPCISTADCPSGTTCTLAIQQCQ
jgi:hypothetical protein